MHGRTCRYIPKNGLGATTVEIGGQRSKRQCESILKNDNTDLHCFHVRRSLSNCATLCLSIFSNESISLVKNLLIVFGLHSFSQIPNRRSDITLSQLL